MPAIQAKIVGDFCNIRCGYCRDRDFDQGSRRIMSLSVLQALLGSLAHLPQSLVRMHWLGGEPTLAGIQFFQQVVDLQASWVTKQWLNTIQTNGTLIDSRWAEFFRAHEFKVGVSIDGTQESHDAERVNLVGHGSYEKAMNGVRILREFGINPSVICVITKRNAHRGHELLEGLVSGGFTNISFNAFYNTATDPARDPYAVSNQAWTQFLEDVFESWLSLDRADVRVREIDDMLAWTQGRVARSCVFRGSCSSWFLVDYDGKVYPCERLGRSVCFGDVTTVTSFKEILTSSMHRDFDSQTRVIPGKCQSCPMRPFCHNGCVAHRVEDGDSAPHYAYCDSRLAFYDYLKKRVG